MGWKNVLRNNTGHHCNILCIVVNVETIFLVMSRINDMKVMFLQMWREEIPERIKRQKLLL